MAIGTARATSAAGLGGARRGWGGPGSWGPVPVALTAAVLLAHLSLLQGLAEDRLGWGSADRAAPRMAVTFVRELAQAEPPRPPAPDLAAAAAPEPAARLPAVAAQPARLAASGPRPAASRPKAAPSPESAAPERLATADAAAPSTELTPPTELPPSAAPTTVPQASNPEAATPRGPSMAGLAALRGLDAATAAAIYPQLAQAQAQAQAASAPPAAPAASAPQPFNWPPSTRLSYRLSGDYRGPVTGRAQVEWLREGKRYQVRMESSAGPLFRRSVASEGELGEQGLVPQRFTGEQKILFASARRWSLSFNAQRVVLSDGSEAPAQAGAQDEASQFVQLTWLFTVQPDRLQVGRSIEVPLAISKKLERWTFDVVGQETLQFPFGAVDTFHVKPRREAAGGDMTAEMWFAPTLQYLPVRILIRQRQEHWVDLTLDKPPLQAAPAGG